MKNAQLDVKPLGQTKIPNSHYGRVGCTVKIENAQLDVKHLAL